MSLQDLKEQAYNLAVHERLELLSAIAQSLQNLPAGETWQFLVARPHPWRKQLHIKGRKLLAATVWRDMITNNMSPEQAAENWDLPLAAVQEAIQYCETHHDLLRIESAEEHYRLRARGMNLEPTFTAG